MINLLPTDQKQSNSYGLRNRVLLRWCVAFTVGIVGIWAIIGFGFYQLDKSIAAQDEQVTSIQQRLENQDIEGVRAQTEDIDTSIKLALQVLEKKVLFSKLLNRIGAVMPEGTILLDLRLQELEGAIDLSARGVNYQSATQVQVNISDPTNNVFSQADIVSVDCVDPADVEPGSIEARYPCVINLKALFGDNSPFLFVNQETESADE